MSRIDIDDLNDLITKKYPLCYVEKIINDVLNISMLVKDEYPDYRQWFLSKQVPGIYDGSRNIIVAHIDDKIVGFVSLKKDDLEKKICTFYVSKSFRKNKIGSILVMKAIEWLEYDKPLITISNDKLCDFIKIARWYNWAVSDIKDGLYRVNNLETILNGTITENNLETIEAKVRTKSLSHLWFFYKLNRVIRGLLNNKFILKRTR